MREILEGEIEGLSVDSSGRLSLAPSATPGPDLAATVVWALAADPKGVLYAGTGNDGRVVKIEERTTQTFFDAPEPEIQALALGPDGRLFVASNPEGRVYAVDKAGKSTVFFDPAERYIWAMAFDPQGRLWVTTGGEGKIYRVDAKGQSTTILTSQDNHVTSLAIGPAGVFAGSSPSGLVYAIDAKDNVKVLFDSNYREVKALLPMPNGSVYAAFVDGRSDPALPRPSPSPSPGATPQAEPGGTITAVEVFAFPAGPGRPGDTPRGGSGPARGAVFLVTALGDADQLWSGDESPFFLFKRNDAIMFGTGSKGRLYEVRDDRTYTLVRTMPPEQLTAATQLASGDVAIASSNPGKLQYLSTRREAKGMFTSAARDFDNIAQIGALEVSSPLAAITYEIRTGNASTPDTTWSGWETIVPGKAPAKPAHARFAQLRAAFAAGAPSPTLSWIQLAYVQRNVRPLIRELTLYPAGDAFAKGGGASAEGDIAGLDAGTPDIRPPSSASGRSTESATLGRKVFHRNLRTLSWRAEDANGDALNYDILYRLDGTPTFTKLREGLDDPIFTWDTQTVPAGRYVIRIVARDQASNPEGRGLSYEKDTEPFEVDNDPPTIVTTVTASGVSVVIRDEINAIRKAEWAKDAGTWTDLTPEDGLADSREETFDIRLGTPAPAAITIRATDAFGNVATQRVTMVKK